MNIRYLIAPGSANETSVWLAFTVINNTITGYYQEINNPSYQRSYSQLDRCIANIQGPKQNFEYVQHNDPQHGKLHSKNPQEVNVDHIHLRYPHAVDTELVSNFLNSLKACENNSKSLSHQITFLTQDVCDDIIKICENYNSTKSPDALLIASNDPDYLKRQQDQLPLPSIFEHEQCLKEKNLPCNAINSKTPSRYLPQSSASTDSLVAGGITPVIPEISSTIALVLTLGIFGLRRLFNSHATKKVSMSASVVPITDAQNEELKSQLKM